MKRFVASAAVILTMLATIFTVEAKPGHSWDGSLSTIFPANEGKGILLWMAVVAAAAVVGVILSWLSSRQKKS